MPANVKRKRYKITYIHYFLFVIVRFSISANIEIILLPSIYVLIKIYRFHLLNIEDQNRNQQSDKDQSNQEVWYRDGKEKLLIFAHRVPQLVSAFLPLCGIVRGDRSTWSTSSSSVFLVPPSRLPLVIGSRSTELFVIVLAARSVLPSFLRARPPASLHGVPLASRGLRRCINRTFSTVTPAPWTRKREHLTTRVCRCREQMVGTRIPPAPRSRPRRLNLDARACTVVLGSAVGCLFVEECYPRLLLEIDNR